MSVNVKIPIGLLLRGDIPGLGYYGVNPNLYIWANRIPEDQHKIGQGFGRQIILTTKSALPTSHDFDNEFVVPNWSETFGYADSGLTAEIDKFLAFNYSGKQIKDIPDWVEIPLSKAPEKSNPFAEIIPGVPNIGVDSVTGRTPVDNAIDAAVSLANIAVVLGNLFAFVFSAQGLALIGGSVILYIGYKGIMQANETS